MYNVNFDAPTQMYFFNLCQNYNKCVFHKRDVTIAKAKLEEAISILNNIFHFDVWINYGQSELKDLKNDFINSFDVFEDDHDTNSVVMSQSWYNIVPEVMADMYKD